MPGPSQLRTRHKNHSIRGERKSLRKKEARRCPRTVCKRRATATSKCSGDKRTRRRAHQHAHERVDAIGDPNHATSGVGDDAVGLVEERRCAVGPTRNTRGACKRRNGAVERDDTQHVVQRVRNDDHTAKHCYVLRRRKRRCGAAAVRVRRCAGPCDGGDDLGSRNEPHALIAGVDNIQSIAHSR